MAWIGETDEIILKMAGLSLKVDGLIQKVAGLLAKVDGFYLMV
ncbi:hypothetical protein [Bacillus sp. JJ722]